MKNSVRATQWVLVYLAICLGPLGLSLISLDPGRGFVINFSVALGFVGLSMLALQFALVARSRLWSSPFGIDLLLQFHRQISYVAIVLILAHPILLFFENGAFLKLLDPLHNPLRAKLGIASIVLMLVLVAISIWRRRLRISYEVWQLLHALLAVAVVVTALLHVLLVGYYVDEPWTEGLWILLSVAFIALGVWVRLIKPLQRWRHQWRVVEVTPELGDAHTVWLEPGHPDGFGKSRFSFKPGQFAWILARHSPFALTYHPFSFSSSAERPERVSFTIKTGEHFTKEVPALRPGDAVYLDGPFGVFSIDRHEGAGFVFIGGGIGVTPLLSMLRTLADREDRRPCTLILANRDESRMTARDQVEELRAKLDLNVVHVLSHPASDWQGERGRISADFLARHLPERRQGLQYFVCGSGPLMDAAESALRRLGIPPERIQTERFSMA